MNPINVEYEEQELSRTISLLCAGFETCYNWWLDDEEDSPEKKALTLDDILRPPAFSVVDLPMLRQAIGMEIVTFEFLAPSNGFFPERLAVGVHPDYLPVWKETVHRELEGLFAHLREQYEEDKEEMQAVSSPSPSEAP